MFEIFLTPCAIRGVVIPTITIGIGNRIIVSAHAAFTYAKTGSATVTLCGAVSHPLVGGNTPYLVYVESSRVFTFHPKTTAYQGTFPHIVRATAPNYPLSTTDRTFNVIGTPPCTVSAYVANRRTIKPYNGVPI